MENVVRSPGEFSMFSAVKRAPDLDESLRTLPLDAWGDEYFPDSILLKEECLVKSCYSFYSPTSSLPTLISSPLWCLPQSLAPVAMWQVNNDSYAVSAEWRLFHMSCEPHWSHPVPPHIASRTQTHTHAHVHTLLWDSYEFSCQWCEAGSVRGDREAEKALMFTHLR